MTEEKIVIDGENALLGRLASYSAKQALLGKTISILNSEKVIISGNRKNIIEKYLTNRRRPNVRFPSQPYQIVKRTIRGMLSYKQERGDKALSRIKCYNGIPKEFESSKKIKSGKENKGGVSLKELSEMLK